MPLFVMIGHDRPGAFELRAQHHEAHVAYVTALNEHGRIMLAGPVKDDASEKSIGAVIVFDAFDLSEARKVVAADPYVGAGVFETLIVQPFRKAFPKHL